MECLIRAMKREFIVAAACQVMIPIIHPCPSYFYLLCLFDFRFLLINLDESEIDRAILVNYFISPTRLDQPGPHQQ